MNIVKNVSLLILLLLSALYSTSVYSMEHVGTGDMDIFQATQYGDLARIQELIAAGANVNQQDTYGNTPLHFASCNGDIAIVQELIAARAHVNKRDANGNIPLHWASYYGDIAIVRALISAGANVNQQTINGFMEGSTPLHNASYNGHLAAVQGLIGAGAALGARNKDGQTPLQLAQAGGHKYVVSYQQRIRTIQQKAPQKARDIAQTLVLATHERLGNGSPLSLLSQDILLRELLPAIAHLAVDAEMTDACQPRTPMMALALASATHARLGANSPLALLPQDLLRNITQLTNTAELQDTGSNHLWYVIL